MRRMRDRMPLVLLALLVVGFHLVSRGMGREYYLTQAVMAAYTTVVALGLCLLMGFAGQVSFGHGAFFALGGYTSALLTTHPLPAMSEDWTARLAGARLIWSRTDAYGSPLTTLTPWLAFAAALILTVVVARGIGIPALRLRGHYLAMATLGFGLIVYRVLLGTALTGTADGISGVPPWTLSSWLVIDGRKTHRIENYYFAWGAVLAAWMLLRHVVAARPGLALRAIHDNETAASSMGVDTAKAKLSAFVLSAAMAAAAGSLMTHYSGGIGPSEAGAIRSVRYVALVAVGGMANLTGVLLAGATLTFLSLRGCFGSYDHAVFGAILIAVVALAPDGPRSLLARFWRRRRGGGSADAEVADTTSWTEAGRDAAAPAFALPWSKPPSATAEAATTHEPLLRVSGLRCQFGGVKALDGVDFEVREGEIKGVIGPNGAGKTTLFNVISGLVRPTAGRVCFAGCSLLGQRPSAIARLGLARTFQNVSLFDRLTARENVLVGLHMQGRAGLLGAALRLPRMRREACTIGRRADELLAFVGLAPLADTPAASLPFGCRRMLELARALATSPRLLLLDEPASGLNPRESLELAAMIRQIRDLGVSLLLVEHDMSLVMEVCDTVLALHFGVPVADGTPATVRAHPRVLAVYLGGEEMADAAG